MSFPDVTRVINDVQRSNLKHKGIVECAVVDYYKKLGKAEALREATGKPEPIIEEAEKANEVEVTPAVEAGTGEIVEGTREKHLSRMNKNELLARCAAFGLVDQVDEKMTNAQLIVLINERDANK